MTFAAKGPPTGHGGDPLELSSYGGVELQANKPPQAPAQVKFREARQRLRLRRHCLVELLHNLGPAPLYHFLNEVERGAPVCPHAERYAALPADFIKANGGDRFPPPVHVIGGGKP